MFLFLFGYLGETRWMLLTEQSDIACFENSSGTPPLFIAKYLTNVQKRNERLPEKNEPKKCEVYLQK